jgi:hypothetical protein
MSKEGKSKDQLDAVFDLDWLKKKESNMLIENNWLNMMVDRGENNDCVIQTDKV